MKSLKDFRKALQPGALLRLSHWNLDGPQPRVFKRHMSRGQVEFLAYYDPHKEGLDWTGGFISLENADNWVVEDNRATLQLAPGRSITYESIDRAEFESLVRQAYPEVADRLLASEKLTSLLKP